MISKHENPYFYIQPVELSANITTDDLVAFELGLSSDLSKTEQTHVNVLKVTCLQNGSVFKLAIDPVKNFEGYLTADRLNIYFYVTKEEIYRIWSYVYEDDRLVEFYDDDNLLINVLNTEEKILNNSYLVCRKKSFRESKKVDIYEKHSFIDVNDNLVVSRMWTVTENGETYFYENFVWVYDKGLISYKSGFRSERDVLYLDNIIICDK